MTGCCLYRPEHVPPPPDPKTIREVDAYSETVKKEYQDFIDRLGGFSHFMGYVLIPLSAATLGLGITGGNPDTIAALGLSGMTMFGLGQWTTNKEKMHVYSIGHTAISCIETASLPLRKSATTISLFDPARSSQFRSDVAEVASAADRVYRIANSPGIPQAAKDDANKAVSSARDLIKDATTAVQALEQTRAINQDNVNIYKLAVQKVDQQTRLAAVKTDQSLSSLRTSLGSLKSDSDKWLGSVAASKDSTDSAKEAQQQVKTSMATKTAQVNSFTNAQDARDLDAALQQMSQSLIRLGNTPSDLKQVLGQLASLPPVSYDDCISNATAAFGQIFLRVSPSTLDITQGKKKSIAIAGGRPPYSPKLLAVPNANNPTFSSPSVEGDVTVIAVETTAQTLIGTYDVAVVDSSADRQSKVISVHVVAP
jgi:hypothetical protein